MVTVRLASGYVVPIPMWAQRLLVVATAWLVLLGTAVPIAAPGLGAWLPAHEHQTLTSFVPPHSHLYERATNAPVGATCEVTSHAHTSAQDAHVVCTTSDDLASGALSLVVPAVPTVLPIAPAESGSSEVDASSPILDPHSSVTTPPPRA